MGKVSLLLENDGLFDCYDDNGSDDNDSGNGKSIIYDFKEKSLLVQWERIHWIPFYGTHLIFSLLFFFLSFLQLYCPSFDFINVIISLHIYHSSLTDSFTHYCYSFLTQKYQYHQYCIKFDGNGKTKQIEPHHWMTWRNSLLFANPCLLDQEQSHLDWGSRRCVRFYTCDMWWCGIMKRKSNKHVLLLCFCFWKWQRVKNDNMGNIYGGGMLCVWLERWDVLLFEKKVRVCWKVGLQHTVYSHLTLFLFDVCIPTQLAAIWHDVTVGKVHSHFYLDVHGYKIPPSCD